MSKEVEPKIFVARLEHDELWVLHKKKRWQQILGVICSGSIMACAGLAIGALVRREWTCLPWVVSGIVAWTATGFFAYKFRQLPKPNERAVVNVDILKEHVQRGRLPAPPAGKGVVSWLTNSGVYKGSDYISWQHLTYPYVAENDGKGILRLYYFFVPTKGAWLKLCSLIGPNFLPLIFEILIAVVGYRHFGARDDVLCAGFAALALLSALTMVTILTASWNRRVLEFSVALQDSSVEELRRFITARAAPLT